MLDVEELMEPSRAFAFFDFTYVLMNNAFSGASGVQTRIRFMKYIQYMICDAEAEAICLVRLNKYERLVHMHQVGTKLIPSKWPFKYPNPRQPTEPPMR